MRPLPVAASSKIEHDACYGQGCFACENRGWFESTEGREEREAEEDRRADARRKGED